jgi:hypothetical protein
MVFLDSENDGVCPVVVAPLLPGAGGADPRFDDKPFLGKSVCLRIDMSGQDAGHQLHRSNSPAGWRALRFQNRTGHDPG